MNKVECNFGEKIEKSRLCMLYSKFKIDGRHWANYPDCKEENCPLMHPELLGNMICNREK